MVNFLPLLCCTGLQRGKVRLFYQGPDFVDLGSQCRIISEEMGSCVKRVMPRKVVKSKT